MSTLEVKLNVDLSDKNSLEGLIKALSEMAAAADKAGSDMKKALADTSETTAEEPKPKAKRKTAAKPKVKKEEPAQEETTESTVKVEDVRALVAEKARDHRAEVKAKLSELGAANVTTLEESKYQEFVDFLSAL